MQSETLLQARCLPDCDYAATGSDERTVVEALTAHMWDEHRLSIDPLDVREMVRPRYRTS